MKLDDFLGTNIDRLSPSFNTEFLRQDFLFPEFCCFSATFISHPFREHITFVLSINFTELLLSSEPSILLYDSW